MIKNKKGMELSINFMVMLILAIAVFAGGLMLMRQMFSSAGDMKQSLSAQQETQIQNMLVNNNDRVVLPFSKREIARGKSGIFGLGINNMLRDGMGNVEESYDVFKITVNFSIAQLPNGAVCDECNSDPDPNSFITMLSDEYEIDKNNQEIIEIPVIVPKSAKRGTYTYNINVSYQESGSYKSYDTIKRISVEID